MKKEDETVYLILLELKKTSLFTRIHVSDWFFYLPKMNRNRGDANV